MNVKLFPGQSNVRHSETVQITYDRSATINYTEISPRLMFWIVVKARLFAALIRCEIAAECLE